jgi:hypothetical protein
MCTTACTVSSRGRRREEDIDMRKADEGTTLNDYSVRMFVTT